MRFNDGMRRTGLYTPNLHKSIAECHKLLGGEWLFNKAETHSWCSCVLLGFPFKDASELPDEVAETGRGEGHGVA